MRWEAVRESPLGFCIYWGVFVILFLVSVGLAFWDMRYVRTQYAIEKREVFRQTLGDEEFRRCLLASQSDRKKKSG